MTVEDDKGRIADWLARAQDAPAQAHMEWTQAGVALLALGSRFHAVRLSAALVRASVRATAEQEIAARLAQLLAGPVIHDDGHTGGVYYALTYPCGGRAWPHQHVAPCLGEGSYLSVPKLARVTPPRAHWVVRPRCAGHLCERPAVEDFVAYGLVAHEVADR